MIGVAGSRTGRRTVLSVLLAFTLLVALGLAGMAGPAGLATSNFEILDGNLKVDNAGHAPGAPTHIDWGSVAETRKQDLPSGQNDDSFTQGTDEQDEPPVIGTGSIPNNKSDLRTFGVFTETVGATSYLHMFWTRVQDPSGTTNMDFEFNQNVCDPSATPPNTAGCSSNGVTPARLPGDLLITYNLSRGGTVPSLFLHRWVTSGACEDSQEGGSGGGTASPASPCWNVGIDLSSAANAAGSINGSAIPAAEADGLGALDARTFGEASVNLSAVFGQTCLTLGGAYVKSRSSDTFTSAMKDFIAPTPFRISNCGSIKIVKKDDAGAFLAGAKFKLYNDDGDGVFEPGAGDPQVGSECTTGSDGTGTCVFNDLFFGSYWVDETQAPAGHTPDANDPRLVTVSSPAQVTVTYTNNRQPASLKVKKVNDVDAPLSGAVFTLFRDNSPFGPPDGAGPNQDQHGAEDTNTGLSCTTGSDGTCTITGILPVGKFWVVETTTPANHSTAPDQWVELALGESKDISSTPFVNQRLHKIIVIVCHQGTNTLAASDVTLGTSTGTTISSPPTGVTEAQLCGITGGSFSDKPHGNQQITVDVGSDAHP